MGALFQDTGRLTVGLNITLTLTSKVQVVQCSAVEWSEMSWLLSESEDC
jgi:hypothetical protein